jgi:hypothetical protein
MSSSKIVPTFSNLEDVYEAEIVEQQGQRWASLWTSFTERFNNPPTMISRSPGRVNLMVVDLPTANFPGRSYRLF